MSFIPLRSALVGRAARTRHLAMPTVHTPELRTGGLARRGVAVLRAAQSAVLVTLFVAVGFGAGWLMAGAGI